MNVIRRIGKQNLQPTAKIDPLSTPRPKALLPLSLRPSPSRLPDGVLKRSLTVCHQFRRIAPQHATLLLSITANVGSLFHFPDPNPTTIRDAKLSVIATENRENDAV